MSDEKRTEQVSRDTVLKLLSDDEIAKVSTAEDAPNLSVGEEYLDLEHLDRGVQFANAVSMPTMGHIVPRGAVGAGTWAKVLAQLAR